MTEHHASATSEENIYRVHHMVMNDWQMNVNQITNTIRIYPLKDLRIFCTITTVSVWWMSRLLTPG